MVGMVPVFRPRLVLLITSMVTRLFTRFDGVGVALITPTSVVGERWGMYSAGNVPSLIV